MVKTLHTNVSQAISDFDAIKSSIEAKGIEVGVSPTSEYAGLIDSIQTGVQLPELTDPALPEDVLQGKEAIDQNGEKITGTLVLPETDIVFSGLNARNLFYSGSRQDMVDTLVPLCQGITSTYQMFYSCKNITSLDLKGLDTSEVTDMSNTFAWCEKVTSIDVSTWNTEKVTNMNGMFQYCSSLKSIDLSSFNTPNLTSASAMFKNCLALESVDLSGLNTSKVSSFNSFFSNSGIKAIDFNKIDLSGATSLSNMFYCCAGLTSIDFAPLDTSKISSMSSMFTSCLNLAEILNFSATNKAGMSIGFNPGNGGRSALRRLTFRTDLDEGVYSIRSAINIKWASFERDGMVEMFNTLPDISSLGLSDSYRKITITDNPCVMTEIALTSTSSYTTYSSYEALQSVVMGKCAGYNPQDVPMQYYLSTATSSSAVSGTFGDITEDMFTGASLKVKFLAGSVAIPEEVQLTEEDRLIATNKGWLLVET